MIVMHGNTGFTLVARVGGDVAAKERVAALGSPKKPAVPRKRKKRAGPVSLHPLSFDDAMRALLAVKPPARASGAKKRGEDD